MLVQMLISKLVVNNLSHLYPYVVQLYVATYYIASVNTVYLEIFVVCIFHSQVTNQDFRGCNFVDESLKVVAIKLTALNNAESTIFTD